LSAIQLLGCSAGVAKDIAVNSKLTEMIGSGVDFARDLVGKSASDVAIISDPYTSFFFAYDTP
jgi:hypothetical protein